MITNQQMNSKIFRKINCQIASSKSKKMDDLKEDINKQVNSTGHWYNTVQEDNGWVQNKYTSKTQYGESHILKGHWDSEVGEEETEMLEIKSRNCQ